MSRLLIAAFAVFSVLYIAVPASAADIGVVLMHGKWGTYKDKSPVGKLKSSLKSAGIKVVTPSVAWSKSRYLDKSYEDAMAEIDAAVDKLKSDGVSKVVVAGHSMGANIALGYAARRDGLAGVIALAPGHIPEDDVFQDKIGHDYKRALAAIAAGKGDDKDKYKDINQGRKGAFNITADIYASWFDPNGPAVMPNNAAMLKANTPLLWVIGTRDRMYEKGEAYAFAKAPAHAMNKYLVVKGGSHKSAPSSAAKDIIAWLKAL